MVTIKDIAKYCNTSPATVSRVLSGSNYPVSDDLRKRVLEASYKLKYRPNIYGRLLRGSKNHAVGVIVPEIANPYYGSLLAEVENACLQYGLQPVFRSSHNSAELEQQQIEECLDTQVCGIIMSSVRNPEDIIENLADEETPIILFDQAFSTKQHQFLSVLYDFHKAGYLAANYLLETGHRKLGYVAVNFERPSRRQLQLGIIDALNDFDSAINPLLTFTLDHFENSYLSVDDEITKGASDLAQQILHHKNELDGLVVQHDFLAMSLITELNEAGVEVPSDISVIGNDNILFSKIFSPRLTTIHQSAKDTAIAAITLLNACLKGESKIEPITLEPKIVVRESVLDRR